MAFTSVNAQEINKGIIPENAKILYVEDNFTYYFINGKYIRYDVKYNKYEVYGNEILVSTLVNNFHYRINLKMV